jgi:hypothetical protein
MITADSFRYIEVVEGVDRDAINPPKFNKKFPQQKPQS